LLSLWLAEVKAEVLRQYVLGSPLSCSFCRLSFGGRFPSHLPMLPFLTMVKITFLIITGIAELLFPRRIPNVHIQDRVSVMLWLLVNGTTYYCMVFCLLPLIKGHVLSNFVSQFFPKKNLIKKKKREWEVIGSQHIFVSLFIQNNEMIKLSLNKKKI
jgi:hypothetical protein